MKTEQYYWINRERKTGVEVYEKYDRVWDKIYK